MVKNDLYLRALRGEQVERPPVWMMRQAGRFLPEFRQLRDKYDFFTRCQTPELVAEITLQPIRRFPLDAVILFSDILVVPQAMGINFKMKENVGPWLDTPIRTSKQIAQVQVEGAEQRLHYVYQGIASTLQMLDGKVPLIGFAGSPWTIFCYCIEGKGSKTFDEAKAFCFSRPAEAQMLLQKITDVTIAYLQQQAQAGVSAVQIFDSWGGGCYRRRITKVSRGHISNRLWKHCKTLCRWWYSPKGAGLLCRKWHVRELWLWGWIGR